MNSLCSCNDDDRNLDILQTFHHDSYFPREDPNTRHHVIREPSVKNKVDATKTNFSPTPLYKAIQNHEWEAVVLFLRTGRWKSGMFHDNFADDFAHLRSPPPREQCKMWVDEEDGGRRLPLHLAILAEAPVAVLDCLLDLYSNAAEFVDSSGRLPLELAVAMNTSDAALLAVLKAWPEAAPKAFSSAAFTPSYDTGVGDVAANSLRNQYLGIILEQTKANAEETEDNEWRKLVADASLEVAEEEDLASVVTNLLNYRKCLLQHQDAFTHWNTKKARKAPFQFRSRSIRRNRDRKAEF